MLNVMSIANRQVVMPAIALLLAGVAAGQDGPGYPSRAPGLDVLPGFRNPPPGYGEVSFYWWVGDPLTRERLAWQLDQLKGRGISALQVNYAHSDQGGRSYGLTYVSDPPLFSEPWWDLFGWFLKQAKQQGMAVSLSDYTLGWAGNGWYMDQILRAHPEMHGAELVRDSHDCSAACAWRPPAAPLSLTAYRLESGRIVPGTAVDLRSELRGGALRWKAPAGPWRLIAVAVKDVPVSLDPMHPLSGRQMIEKFFQHFEDRNPGESGRGLNFFFSDELSFGVRGWLWNRFFAEEFRKRKGYDVVPELASLFEQTGPRAVKTRLDYSDVMVSLEEENYFRPLYEWHRSRGMVYGCDHGGRGRDVTEFGDYFRTQRWMTAPGNDQPGLASDVIKNKVSSSIAHLYERPRTWLEGYYGSGWGTTSAQVVDATWRNFAQGHNLLTLHGLYYSTKGGWWEWAPPCNHFRMPYWAHMGEFLRAVERMSYLLSQGEHRADVAIVYPVAAVEAGPGGKDSVEAAFSLARRLYSEAVDFDFIDFESLARAKIEEGKLKVAGEQYRVLVLPAMKTVRHSTLEKAVEFHRGGGMVVILGEPPEGSERSGEGDPHVLALAGELSPSVAKNADEILARMDLAFLRDFHCAGGKQPSVLHRRAGSREIYMVYGVARDTLCTFRSVGRVELWDPWSGGTAPLPVLRQSPVSTTIEMPLENTEAQVIVFSPGRPVPASAGSSAPKEVLPVEGDLQFELKPTLDNRYGDYRLPATRGFLSAEARRFRYRDEGPDKDAASDASLDDSQWPLTTYSYGPRFWKLGPLPAGAATAAFEKRLAAVTMLNPAVPLEIEGRSYRWQPYEFSFRWGTENDSGHQGYHGLKAEMPRDFIALGRLVVKPTTTAYMPEPEGTLYYLWTSVASPRAMQARILAGGNLPSAVWINQTELEAGAASANLAGGHNVLLLRYQKPGRGSFLLVDPRSPAQWKQTIPLASHWYQRPGLLPFDTRPGEAQPAGWYRTTAPPGLRGLTIVTRGRAALWVDGRPVSLPAARGRRDGSNEYKATLPGSITAPARVAIRVEQERGSYAGAAFPEPVAFDCETGAMAAGDWSRIDGLASYSGGAWYRKQLTLTAGQARGKVWLDLGEVSSSADVLVNCKRAGIRLAPPFRVDVSGLIRPGGNRIEVLVFSALANHYETIPTRYRRPGPSGLIGPVRLLIH